MWDVRYSAHNLPDRESDDDKKRIISVVGLNCRSANAAFFTIDNDFVLQADGDKDVMLAVIHGYGHDSNGNKNTGPQDLPRFCRHLYIGVVNGSEA